MFNHTETQERIETLEELLASNVLIVYNDDVNTFDHVIESLVKVCKHESIQAEQCAVIIHNKGKCQVKSGDYSKLEPMCTALLDRGISAVIE